MIGEYAYLAAIAAVAAVSAALSLEALRHLRTPGAGSFAFLMADLAVMIGAGGGIVASRSPETANFCLDVTVGCSALTGPALLIFAFRFCGGGRRTSQWMAAALFAMPALTLAALAFGGPYDLVFQARDFIQETPRIARVVSRYGPVFHLHTAYSYACILAAMVLLARRAVRSYRMYRRQSIALLLGILAALASNALFLLRVFPPWVNPMPIGFALMGLALSWALFYGRMFEVAAVARGLLIDQMTDGMLVLDAGDRIVDFNPALQAITEIPLDRAIGSAAVGVFRDQARFLARPYGTEAAHEEISMVRQGEERRYDAQVTPLLSHRGRPMGRMIVLRDVSALAHAREELKEQAIRDPLTGLHNRRYFAERMQEELDRARRNQRPVSLIMADVDRFKSINDSYGHAAGDATLQSIAVHLGLFTRRSDVVCRYGGEEFMLLMPEMDLESAARRAEQIRQGFQAIAVRHEGSEVRATISLGVAAFPEHGATADAVLKAVDEALYRAKDCGRNRVAVYSPKR